MNNTDIKKHLLDHVYGYPPKDTQIENIKIISENDYSTPTPARVFHVQFNCADRLFNLNVITPEKAKTPCPVFLFLNTFGNHTVTSDYALYETKSWVPKPAEIGAQSDRFDILSSLKQGYAIATIHESDIAADSSTLTPDGGLISKWAWGLQRCVDAIIALKPLNIDTQKIALAGFSRRGKAALLASAFDDRIWLTVAHQSGTGGAAPHLKSDNRAETIAQINAQFPHWFCNRYKEYNNAPENLPVTTEDFLSLIAPRALLITNAKEDHWSDPKGTYQVYQNIKSLFNQGATIAYSIRDGKHSLTQDDWRGFLKFANHIQYLERIEPHIKVPRAMCQSTD